MHTLVSSRHTAELIVSILGSFSRSIFQSQQINFYFWHDKSFSWDNRKKNPAKFDTYIHKFSDRKASERWNANRKIRLKFLDFTLWRGDLKSWLQNSFWTCQSYEQRASLCKKSLVHFKSRFTTYLYCVGQNIKS